MWNLFDLRGTREGAKTKLAGLKQVPEPVKAFIAGQIDDLPASYTAVSVTGFGVDHVVPGALPQVTRRIEVTLRGLQV